MKKIMILIPILLLNCGSRKVSIDKKEVKQEVKQEQTTKQEVESVAKTEDKTEVRQEEQTEKKEVETQVKTVYKKVYYPSGVLKSETAISENSKKMKLEISNLKKELKNEIKKSDSLGMVVQTTTQMLAETKYNENTKEVESVRPYWQVWSAIFILICTLVFVIYKEFFPRI